MMWSEYIGMSNYMSNLENQNYEEAKLEFFLEGKDPLQTLWDSEKVEGNERDNKNEDSNLEKEQ